MGFDRVGAKLSARESMRVNKPSPLWVTLVYFILTSVLVAVIGYFIYDPITDLYLCASWGYQPEEIAQYILQNHSTDLILYGVFRILWLMYAVFMGFGYTSYALRMARNEQPGVRHLFDGFARPFRVLWATILMAIFITLWSLLILVPLTALVLGILLAVPDYILGAALIELLMVTSVVAAIAFSYRYSLTYYFMLDDPDCTARQAIRRSKEAMRGWKMSMFCLDLSFLGWIILSAVLSLVVFALFRVMIANILAFWLLPYRMATEANFYDSVTGAKQPGEGGVGPIYEYRSNDGPQPF